MNQGIDNHLCQELLRGDQNSWMMKHILSFLQDAFKSSEEKSPIIEKNSSFYIKMINLLNFQTN